MSIEGIRYPADLQIEEDTDYFKIQVLSYNRKSLTEADIAKVEGVQNILLPMPSNIQDANSVSWGEEKMNNLTAEILNLTGLTQNINVFGDNSATFTALESKIDTFLNKNGAEVVELFKKQLAAEAVNIFGANVSLDQILARKNGAILNPNLELLFNGVSLRDFRFSFKMTPRDDKERNNIIRIIRSFKKYMAASKSGKDNANLYLKTPNVFKLSYMKGANLHPFLHKFKDCALKGVSVNYTGENVYATYWDGTPISIILDLNFQELTPIYNEEYADPTEENVKLGVGY